MLNDLDEKWEASWITQSSYLHDVKAKQNSMFIYLPPGFPGGSDDRESACNAGDLGLTPGLGRLEKGIWYPLQYSFLDNPLDRGAWQATVYGMAKSWTWLSSYHFHVLGFPGGTSGKDLTCQCRRHKRCRFDPWVGKIPWRRAWQPTPGFLPGESHGQRSLAGYSPQGCKELDTTEAT